MERESVISLVKRPGYAAFPSAAQQKKGGKLPATVGDFPDLVVPMLKLLADKQDLLAAVAGGPDVVTVRTLRTNCPHIGIHILCSATTRYAPVVVL